MSTITLSSIPDLTSAVGVPRLAAIEYPLGYLLGQPGDAEGQKAILRATLQALAEISQPSSITHLPFQWPISSRVRFLLHGRRNWSLSTPVFLRANNKKGRMVKK